VFEGQEPVRQAGEGYFTLGAAEALHLTPLSDSSTDGQSQSDAMSLKFSAAPGTTGNRILYTRD
jgi:hypothetical protein